MIKNRDSKEVHICQVGWAGIRLGKIEIEIEKSKKSKKIIGTAMGINHQLDFI